MTPQAHIIWRWWRVLSRGRRSLTAPRSRVIISLPMAVYPCVCIRLSGCDRWHQRRVFGGGEASLAASDEVEPREEEEEETEEEEEEADPPLPASFVSLSYMLSVCPAPGRPQSSSSLDTLVAMSLKASGAPHRRLNRTPLL